MIYSGVWARIQDSGVGGQPADGRCWHMVCSVHCDDPKIELGTGNYILHTLKINGCVITELLLQTIDWSFFIFLGDECKVFINLKT